MRFRPIRIAIVGSGRIAHSHAEALLAEGAELVAAIDVNLQAATEFADTYGALVVAENIGSAVARCDIDAVIVCSPSALHEQHALESLELGLHVLVEKPFATTPAAASGMVVAASAANRVIMSAQVLRYMPIFTWAQKFIKEGQFGAPVQAIERRLVDRDDNWDWWKDLPAFLISHWGSHSIDLFCHLFDDTVSTAYCQADSVRSTLGVIDDFSLTMRFNSGFRATSTMSFSSRLVTHDIVLIGTEATLSFDCYRSVSVDGKVMEQFEELENVRQAFRAQFAEFATTIRSGRTDERAMRSVIAALNGLEAAERSALNGNVITVSASD